MSETFHTNVETYIDNPDLCPNCGSGEIMVQRQCEFDSFSAWRGVACGACQAEWHDLYTLTGYEAR